MKEHKKCISLEIICIVLILATVFVVPVCSADITPYSRNSSMTDVISVNSEIDNMSSDRETAYAFLISPTYDFVFNCLKNHNKQEKVSASVLSQILYDFPYSIGTETIVMNITIGELLSGMETKFVGHGWTGTHIECVAATPRREIDLENAYNFIQYIAKQDGFTEPIPLVFSEPLPVIHIGLETDKSKIPIVESKVESNTSTRAKDDRFRPIIGGIQAYSCHPSPFILGGGYFTLGLSVKFSNGQYGVISCGHGNYEGYAIHQPDSSDGNQIGLVSKRYVNGLDASLITLLTPLQSKGSLNGQPWNLIGEVKDVNSYGLYDTSKTFRFCGISSGNVDNLVYGRIEDVTLTSGQPQNLEIVFIEDALLLQGTAIEGDSGGPVYQNYDGLLPDWNNKVVGIVAGRCEIPNSLGNTMQYVVVQPIMPILSQLSSDGYSFSVLLNGNT